MCDTMGKTKHISELDGITSDKRKDNYPARQINEWIEDTEDASPNETLEILKAVEALSEDDLKIVKVKHFQQ